MVNNQQLFILFHDDWEINGDGTGDPAALMFDPARRILDICDRYGARYTFFAEIGQQLNMLRSSERKWRIIAHHWEDTLRDAVRRGHDVQLHLHPQWIGGTLENGTWQLDLDKWHTGYVDNTVLEHWITQGKEYLEDLLGPVKQGYCINCFRAGGWMCQPSGGLYKALTQNRIICDATVMKGRYFEFEDGSYIDFRDAYSRFDPWEVDPKDFAQTKQGSGLFELPVYTEQTAWPHSLYLLRKAFRPWHYYRIFKKYQRSVAAGTITPGVEKKGDLKEHYGSFGYMHYQHLLEYVDEVKKHRADKKIPNHLIFLTHSKSFYSYQNFENLLKKLSNRNDVTFSTTRKYINQYIKPHVNK